MAYEVRFIENFHGEELDRSLWIQAIYDEICEVALILRLKGYKDVSIHETADFIGNHDYKWWIKDGIYEY